MKNITKIRVLPYHNYAGSKYDAFGIENTLPLILPSEDEMKKAKDAVREIIRGKVLVVE